MEPILLRLDILDGVLKNQLLVLSRLSMDARDLRKLIEKQIVEIERVRAEVKGHAR